MSTDALGAGTFLIASPTLRDPNFSRTVVLLCEHTAQGSMGLVLNRPGQMPVAEALRGVTKLPPRSEILYMGGPVQPESLLVLHRTRAPVPGAQPVGDGVALGGDMQILLDLLAAARGPEERLRVYAGYAGWGEGQLAAEMATGSWFTCPASAHFVFDADPESMWAEVIRALGAGYAHLITMPLDPRVN